MIGHSDPSIPMKTLLQVPHRFPAPAGPVANPNDDFDQFGTAISVIVPVVIHAPWTTPANG